MSFRQAQTHGSLPLFALFGANAISQIGNMVSSVAFPWFVLETTGSAAQTGLMTAVSTLPLVVMGLLGGSLIDRTGAKQMSVGSDVLSALTTASVPLLFLSGLLNYPLLLLIAFLGAVLDSPGSTARQSILPDLIRRAGMQPERANAIYQAIFRASILLGPPIGGALISLFGTANVLWFDAATFVVSALLIGMFVPARQAISQGGVGSGWAELTSGVRFLWREPLLRALLAIFALVDLLANALLLVVVPVYAARIYNSSVAFGAMISSFGGGMLAGTVVFGIIGRQLSRRLCIGGGLLLSAVAALLLLFLPALAQAVALLAIMGFGLGPGATLAMTIFQERTPAELRGRVFGARTAIQLACLPLGVLATGVLLERFGIMPTLVIIGIPYLLTGILALSLKLDQSSETRSQEPEARGSKNVEALEG